MHVRKANAAAAGVHPVPAQTDTDEESMDPKLKALVVIASFGRKQDQYLEQLIQKYKSMPIKIDIVVTSDIARPLPEGVEIVVGLPTKDSWSLPFAHKKVMAERVNDYDLFIYSENDTMVTEENIEAFLRVSNSLPANEIPGFMRYENGPSGVRRYSAPHAHFHWDPASPCIRGPYTFAFFTNEHAACFLITRAQLQSLLTSGRFLVAPYQGKYDLACTAATDPYTRGGFRKLICISHFDDFLLHHMGDKYTGADFTARDQGFDKQIPVLLAIAKNGEKPLSLLQTETKLPAARYSKNYYEPVREEVVREFPQSARTVLSLGSGTGRTEEWLVKTGRKVTAVPLDPVIGACLEGTGVEVVCGDLRSVREKLAAQKFDCMYLSNILHLVENPAAILKGFAELLNPGGHILIVTPTVGGLRDTVHRLMGKRGLEDVGNYELAGVHKVSGGDLQSWLRAAGCCVERINWVIPLRFQRIANLFPALFNAMFGSEIIALARKAG